MISDADSSERRSQTDRRGADRQGKYDRRRNRCAHCQNFEFGDLGKPGFCSVHKQAFNPDDFACVHFEPLS